MNFYALYSITAYSVTALGFLLSLFWMLFMFRGKSISGADDRPQTIKYGKLELSTNTITGVLTASLVTAVLPLCLLFYLILSGILKPGPPASGEKQCHALLGKYRLHQKYVFTAEANTRSIANHGAWKAIGCEYNEEQETYILKGEDDTDFDVEVIIGGKYERIATARYVYSSEVTISREGKLLGRSFEAVLKPEDVIRYYKDRDGNKLNISESFIDEKVARVIELRNEKHRDSRTTPCVPALGELGGRVMVAFLCQGYTRAMIKMS